MAKLIFLLLCAFTYEVLSQCTQKKAEPSFKRSVYEYSIELLSRIAQEKENHFVSSTLSTWILLTYTSLGSEGTTLSEMKKVLKLSKNRCFNYKYLKIASKTGNNDDPSVVLERSSAVFVDDKINILESFRKRMNTSRICSFENVQFDDADVAAQRINDFVSQKTHEVIEEVVSPADLSDVSLIIIDAIFFKGTWTTPFPFENTSVQPFYNEKGIQIGEINLMTVMASFKVKYIENIMATALEIPYGSGNRYSMLIVLPKPEIPLYTVIDKLKLISLQTVTKAFEESEAVKVVVQIPRFKINSDISNLKELLEDMGLNSMFDSNEAQFPYISDYPLYVSNIIQKADIEATEEGTVAAAVTEEEFSWRSAPIEFNANKPFLFIITDKKYDVPLFVGAYSKPTIF